MSIETQIHTLESLLEKLESEDCDIDTAIKDYAEGLKLAEKTLKDLAKVDTKLKTLSSKADSIESHHTSP